MMKVLLLWYQFWQIFHTIICRFLSTFENSHGQRFSNRMGSLPFCIMTMSISTPFWILILSISNPNPGWIVAQWRKIQCWKMTLSWTSHSPSFSLLPDLYKHQIIKTIFPKFRLFIFIILESLFNFICHDCFFNKRNSEAGEPLI